MSVWLAAFTMDEVHFISRLEIDNLKEDTRRLIACHGWDDGQDPFALLDTCCRGRSVRMAVGTAEPSWVLLGLQTLRPIYICVSAYISCATRM
jgi:hypothetical protein